MLIASTQHMLADCVVVKSIWQIIDKLGSEHWEDYSITLWFMIQMTRDTRSSYVYDPLNIYHVYISALWAFWVIWCKHFYHPNPVEDWKVELEILTKF